VSTLTPVFDGNICIGHVLQRGCRGFEAFNADDASRGMFTTAAEAAASLTSTKDINQ
jgi:hypothetical protein